MRAAAGADGPEPSNVAPANGGVLVANRYGGTENAHDTGTVIAVGHGVPWLRRGQRVAYKRTAASEIEINLDRTSIDFAGIPIIVAGNSPDGTSRTWVVLIDQRDVSAVLEGEADLMFKPQNAAI